jgi:hypothetical protein
MRMMKIMKRLGLTIAIALVALCALDFAGQLPIPGAGKFASTAQAIIGRPLTPVSVAGVARRTTRRCMAGVYYC